MLFRSVSVDGKNWYSSDVDIEVSGKDETSEPIHYEYRYPGKNENWVAEQDMAKKIEITDEGETVIAVRVVDTAGNVSEEKRETIRIDTKAPTFGSNQITINASNVTATSVNFTVFASDEGSGRNGHITYVANVTSKDGSSKKTAESSTGEFNITGLNKNIAYDVTVIAKDPLGHESTQAVGGFATKGELKVPNVTAVAKNSGDNGNGGWIKGTAQITITDSASQNETSAEYAYYKITKGGAEIQTGGPIPLINGVATADFTKNGEYTITAWLADGNGANANRGEEGTGTVKIDTDKPLSAVITASTANQGPATNVANKDYYYHDKATISVSPRTDATSGIYGVRIQVTGANSDLGDNIYETTTSKEIEITKEGQ